MTSAFDPLRAAREELAGMADVERVISQRERQAEEQMSLAEQELNAIRKLRGYLRITQDTLRERIAKLEEEEQRRR